MAPAIASLMEREEEEMEEATKVTQTADGDGSNDFGAVRLR